MERTNGSAKVLALGIGAMVVLVTASNVLVQVPLGAFLTWGAFTYPFAFLVTDVINRRLGPAAARWVVAVGFLLAVGLSVWLATPRIALASGTAFLAAQLVDVAVFDRLRAGSWWRAPLVSSAIGSVLDTVLFFSLAFSATLSLGFPVDDWALEPTPFLGFGATLPLWISLAVGDFGVKMLVALAALGPYRLFAGQTPRPA